MLKNFLMKKMLASQMKQVPEGEREAMLAMVEKDPELFMNIAKEIQVEMKSGKDQMTAAMSVMPKYQERLKTLMAETKK